MKVIPVKPFVRVESVAHLSMESYCKSIRELSTSEADFVEATVFSESQAVVMQCDFAVGPGTDGHVNHILTWHKPLFYTHVRAVLERCISSGRERETLVEYIPTLQYIFRH